MNHFTRLLPHALTLLALVATTLLLVHYWATQQTQRRITETSYLANNWDAEMLHLTYQDALGEGEALPCPARVERQVEGRFGTYVLAATITRMHAPLPMATEPEPTCVDTPYYLIETTAGWDAAAAAIQTRLVNDIVRAREERDRLMQPHIRKAGQPLTITPLPALGGRP